MPLENTQFKVGSTVKLFCRVSGHPTPRVEWYKDGQCISNQYEVHKRPDVMMAEQTETSRFTFQSLEGSNSDLATNRSFLMSVVRQDMVFSFRVIILYVFLRVPW